jgi:hypothetical protein
MKVVCIYNDQNKLSDGLLSSYNNFFKEVDLLLVDNSDHAFSSMPQAINSAIKNLDDDEPLIFAHQDVIFLDEQTKKVILENCKYHSVSGYYYFGVVGVNAFKKISEESGVNSIISAGRILNYRSIAAAEPVLAIDECVMITNRRTIVDFNLFQDYLLTWHLYAVDASLQLIKKNIVTYVLPISIHHISPGNPGMDYLKLSLYLLKKHNAKVIYTTCRKLTRINLWLKILEIRLMHAIGLNQ